MKTPKEIARDYLDIGAAKTAQSVPKAFLLAALAGAYIALAGVAATLATSIAGKLAGACIFPAGLAMIVLAGGELFTGNSLLVLPLYAKRITPGALLRSWAVVYLGNLAGAVLIAALAVVGGSLDGVSDAVLSTASAKVSLGFADGLVRGVLCNVLVCAAVWMTMAADSAGGKLACLYLPIVTFVLCGFEHCVANMFYIPAGLFMAIRQGVSPEGLTWAAFFLKNLLPVTLGNMLGGCSLATALWSAYGVPVSAGDRVRF